MVQHIHQSFNRSERLTTPDSLESRRRPGRRLVWQLALSITAFIFVMELVVLGFSHVSKHQELHELRDALEQDVLASTGQHFEELHPGILDQQDIDRRLSRFTINYALITMLISFVVSLGTLVVFHRIAGRYLLRVIDLNARYDSRKVDADSLYPEDRLPSNELADLITTRNRMIESIMHHDSHIEEKLEQAQQQIVHTARLSLVGELTSTMVHDIKNPLAVILGRTELMKKRYADEKLIEELSSIEDAARKILELSERMGRFSRLSDHRQQRIQLSRVIEDSLEMTRSKLSSHAIDVRLEMPGDLHIEADPIGMEQVFANLFSNAADAMADSPSRILEIRWTELEGNVLITVEDTGTGIPAERIENVFKPFFTTKEVGKGTGLGLSSCKRIVERHGGTIQVQSREGRGTRFAISLPTRGT